MESPYSVEFTVPEELVGLAIGSHGGNIHTARGLEGITSVEFNPDTYSFKV